jgi:hypothetical protein
MATVTELQAEIARLRERYRIAQNGLANLNKSLQSNQAILARYTNEVSSIPGQIAGLESQINANQNTSPASAATSASEDGPQGPTKSPQAVVGPNGRITTSPDTTAPSNAIAPATLENAQGSTTGTDDPVRTTEQTQATGTGYNGDGNAVGLNVRAEDGTLSNLRKNPDTGELYDPGGIPGGVDLTTSPGNTTNDDNVKPSATANQTALNGSNNTTVKITPRPNPLDRFYSYSYSVSVYMLSSTQYKQLLAGKQKKIDGYFLLFQSAGAPLNKGGPKSGMGATADVSSGSDSGRNPFFPNDYYIDSVIMDSSPLGKGTNASHGIASLKMTVVEPLGITLLDNLQQAVENMQQPGPGKDGRPNYVNTDYLMVIRFYGYDESGNQVQIRGGINDVEGTSDNSAVIEKFIPFHIAKINWSIGTKLVSYEIDCVPQGLMMGAYTGRGTIPYDVQLSNTTVDGLLGGNVQYTTPARGAIVPTAQRDPEDMSGVEEALAAPPQKAVAAPDAKKTISQGLMGALNDYQKQLVERGIYTIADNYEIAWVGAGVGKIRDATLRIPGAKVNISTTTSNPATTTDPKSLDSNTDQVDMRSRNFSITAGQQIVQAIELAIRNSSYIFDQQLVIVNPDGTTRPNPNVKNSPMQWFNISMSATKIGDQPDPKRNDYAYNIKYTITPYIPTNFQSAYFNSSRFPGVHKSYPYWFTGKNVAVLEYQENLDALYNFTMSGQTMQQKNNRQTSLADISAPVDIAKYVYSPRSAASSQGGDGKQLEPGANAQELLLYGGSVGEVKLKIIGDPDWIQQGSLFREITDSILSGKSANTGFGIDGSIQFDTLPAMYEVSWQRPEDYDLSTGLADPYSKGAGARVPLQSRVYTCIKVLSEFRGGKFEQTLTGTLYTLARLKDKTAPATAPGTNNVSNASGASSSAQEARNDDAAVDADAARQSAGRTQAELDTAGLDEVYSRSARGGSDSSAATLGAQGSMGYPTPAFVSSQVSAASDNLSITAQTQAQGAIQNAPPPKPATDGDNNVLDTPAIESGPPRLNAAGLNRLINALPRGAAPGVPTSTTIPNNQSIVRTS